MHTVKPGSHKFVTFCVCASFLTVGSIFSLSLSLSLSLLFLFCLVVAERSLLHPFPESHRISAHS